MQLVETSNNSLKADGKFLYGLFAEMDTQNQNGRNYPDAIYTPAFEELLPKIQERRLMGELDHPIDYDEIRLSNVSHVITESHIEENNGIKQIYGTVELLDTPAGLIAQALVKAGIPIGVSSRGVGATKPTREGVEVTSLKLITYDLVAEPSFANAILSPDKSKELSESLDIIESNLPLNESVETSSIRDTISRIRESLICETTSTSDDVDIDKTEVDVLKSMIEEQASTIKADTAIMTESRKQIKELKKQLSESQAQYQELYKKTLKLQEAYNYAIENPKYESQDEIERLKEENISLRKELAAEKRGMSYSRVSDLLEGAQTTEEVESRLNSLSSMRKKHKTEIITESAIQTMAAPVPLKKSKLATIVSRV